MLNKSVARRYAEAFFSIAQEAGKVDQFQQELEKVVQIISETEHLQEYFDHLLIPPKEKKELIDKIFADQFFRMIYINVTGENKNAVFGRIIIFVKLKRFFYSE